jgi:hypothetical protein
MNLPIITRTKTGALCSLKLINGEYVMSGPTGTHTLDAANTNDERLAAHWDGFIANNGGEIEESDIVEAIKEAVERFQNDAFDYSPDECIDNPDFGIFHVPSAAGDFDSEKMEITILSTTPYLDFTEIRKILKPLRKLGKLKIATKKEVFEDWKEQNPYLANWHFDREDSYTAWHWLTVYKA